MATKHDSIAVFMAKLLAPLPVGEEPVDTKAFRREIERDLRAMWSAAFEYVRLAGAKHTATAAALQIARDPEGSDLHLANNVAFAARVDSERRMCFVPAPTMRELRWKKRSLANRPADQDVVAAIARDEARLTGVAA